VKAPNGDVLLYLFGGLLAAAGIACVVAPAAMRTIGSRYSRWLRRSTGIRGLSWLQADKERDADRSTRLAGLLIAGIGVAVILIGPGQRGP
jgi:hypothetical protein